MLLTLAIGTVKEFCLEDNKYFSKELLALAAVCPLIPIWALLLHNVAVKHTK